MPSLWSYTVTYLATSKNISSFVNDIEMTIAGTGEISSCILLLNANNGQFITQSNGGNTPILDQFDQILIDIADGQGNAFFKIFEVDKFRPIEDAKSGTQLRVELLARERHVQYVNFARQYYYADAYSTLKDLADRYNISKGSLQPAITKQDDASFNELPKWTSNIYDFNFAETPIYEGQKHVVDKLGTSVSNGGAADFFELYYDDATGTHNADLRIKAFSSGSKPANPITISSSLAVNVGESEAQIESIVGTNILAWGAIDQGSLPINFSQFRGILEAFRLFPAWISGQSYPQNAIVQYDTGSGALVYRSNINNNTSTPPTNWTQIFPYTLLGSLQYSPWTVDKAGLWKNSGSNQTGSGGFGRGCWDSNLVIVDGDHARTWVDTRKNNSANIPVNHRMLDNGAPPNAVPYRGYRVLVDSSLGALGGDWALNGSKDRFGNSFVDAIVEHNGGNFTGSERYKNWDCLMTKTNPPKGNAILIGTNNQCAIIDQGKNYRWTGAVWTDDSTTSMGNDCFHSYFALTNDAGVDQTPTSGGSVYGVTSAINVSYKYTPWFAVPPFDDRNNSNYYSIGCWLNFRFPYPVTKDNGITEQVGQLYGGNGKASREPVTLDAQNMNYTPTGNIGFNASDSENLGPVSALGFMIRLLWLDRSGIKMLAGNFKMRCSLYDVSGNVAVQDFTIPFNDMWEDIQLPLNNFKIYRARAPRRWGLINSVIPLAELEILNVFQWRHIKQIAIQLQEVYDDEGRYFPEGSRINNDVIFTGLGQATISLWIDSFRFVKPLLASSGTVSDRNLETYFLQRQNISNYQQLKADVQSMKQIYGFRHKQFDITTTGKCDINFGDSFYYTNPRIISDSDNGPNTIKLVAKKIIYKISRTAGGPGGFLRTISGVKRFPAS